MKKQKTAKRAFISSLISLALCVTMLVGTTFAWYTDSVTSGRNTIVSGSLEMVVEYYTGNIGDTDNEAFADDKWTAVTDATAIFNDSASFEPGAAQVAYVRVKNNGDLAFKYSLAIAIDSKTIGKNKAGQNLDLTDYLKFGAVSVDKPYRKSAAGRDAAIAAAGSANISSADFVTSAVLEAKDDANNKSGVSDVIALVVYMPSSLGNEVNPDPNNKPSITFGLNALATQAVIENDSFSTDYDASAVLPELVATSQELKQKLENGDSVALANNIVLKSNEYIAIAAGKEASVDLNGHTLSVTAEEASRAYLIENTGTLIISDSSAGKTGKITSEVVNPDGQDSPTYASNTISNKGTLILESGTIENHGTGYACYPVDNYNGATFIMNGGKLIQNNAYTYALRMFMNSTTTDNVVIINGGEISGGYGVWMQYPNGNANKGSLTINGGTVNANDGYAVYAGAPGSWTRDATNVNIKITGGTINGTGAWFGTDTAFESISVTGGTFANFGAGAAGGSKFVTGGTYKSTSNFTTTRDDTTPIVADGYIVKDNGDGTFSVVAE